MSLILILKKKAGAGGSLNSQARWGYIAKSCLKINKYNEIIFFAGYDGQQPQSLYSGGGSRRIIKFKASLSFIANSRPDWTIWNPLSKKTNKTKANQKPKPKQGWRWGSLPKLLALQTWGPECSPQHPCKSQHSSTCLLPYRDSGAREWGTGRGITVKLTSQPTQRN